VAVEVGLVRKQWRGDVVERRDGCEQVEALEDEADPAPIVRLCLARERGYLDVADEDSSFIRAVHRPDDVQERRLAGAGRPGDRRDRAGGDGKADVLERRDGDPLGELVTLADRFELDRDAALGRIVLVAGLIDTLRDHCVSV